ncbi:aminotransferase class I/II-fold pyridoxal phosphate-dependent enzyme [Maribellus comscasis]|uniref:Aminotransferase n=1 Tax=Maribellus comscasis TaxID=2681766 RepID=A0A6I6JVV5_9BACT|nr:histidinol-phosphate transaminase [Maribellus comscasis]QGY45238.1 aminotransferase class I/II-fold pyridoxal phosphate-dependent enzyme [Maribellus comscasis]
MYKKKIKINHHLFYDTSHSPSLVDIVGEEMLGHVTDFCFIANPYYPTTSLLRKLKKKLPVVIKSYPSSNPILAQKDLASVLNVNPEYLVVGNGATELITLLQKHIIESIAIPIPTFGEYIEKLRSLDQAKLFQLPAENDYQLDLKEYAEWINLRELTSALIINPGNPTGQFISVKEMVEFLGKMRHLKLILIDESFIDFSGKEIPSLIQFVESFPNLVIVRSMSKHCGIPGLRLGYCCTSNKDFLKQIRNALPVWNINTLAEYFLTQLKSTDHEYHIGRKKVIDDMGVLYDKLSAIGGLKVYPSGSNFLLIKICHGPTATEIQKQLLEEYGVYVRDCSNKVGLDKFHIRAASQGRQKDKILIRALKKVLGSKTIQ